MYKIRNAAESDGKIMRMLARKCGTLDLHTPYTYWVAAAHCSECCFILETDGTPIGYIMAVDAPEIVFIRQIGILPEYRGKGLSRILIASCVDYTKERKKDIEVTIAEDNENSYRSFARFCERKGIIMVKTGTVVIDDLLDTTFKEKENRYLIRVTG